MSTYWAQAGFSYLKYLNRATSVMRQAVKEPVKSKLLERERIILKKFKVQNGEEVTETINKVANTAS
eukprot:CAMPEP_0185251164 /NCGR_PEP_ID=MMETSP1359-20130426/608_1 /TAXON_ID=552665 /ORGANISM="Bigelowiella longifila, Strain CCMP242" /LENGTH=66 /DNA_ID=CAMNT_0027832943 /DNA_START=294 /DNA_END=494 /DNA_ORIENTATION=-